MKITLFNLGDRVLKSRVLVAVSIQMQYMYETDRDETMNIKRTYYDRFQ